MRRQSVFRFMVGTLWLLGIAASGRGQLQPHGPKTVEKATNVLNSFMNMSDQHVPRSILQRARGLIILPAMVKLEVGAHGRRGKGVAVARDEDGHWHPPSFVTMTGGTVDVQGQGKPTDIILVLNTPESVRELYSGRFKVGVDAVAGAGPVGRGTENSADDQEQADMYSYSRSGGSFRGTTIDGAEITMDAAASRNYYQSAAKSPDGEPLLSNAQLPLPAAQFLAALDTYNHAARGASSNPAGSATATNETSSRLNTTTQNASALATETRVSQQESDQGGDSQVDTLETTRRRLATAAKNLGGLLDESWRQYLSLPQGVFTGEGVATVDSLRRSLRRFETVANEKKYSVLLQRQEFQQAYRMLRRYYEQVEAATSSETGSPSASAASGDGGHAEIR